MEKKNKKVLIDYDSAYIKALSKNCTKVLEEIKMKKLPKKYILFCKNAGLALNRPVSVQELIDSLRKDDLLRYSLTTKPDKQCFHEKYAASKIIKMPHVRNFENLPTNGKNAIYMHCGEIITNLPNKTVNVRSLDFKWEVKTKSGRTIVIYATHKHTKDSGGTQNGQLSDVEHTLKHFVKNTDNNIRCLAIVDGGYYQMRYRGFPSRIAYLRDIYENELCKVMCINELEEYIEEVYQNN